MMIRRVILLVVLLVPSLAWGQNLFIMGWDGAGKRNMDILLAEGKLPNLQNFINNGGTNMHIEIHTDTHTISSWTILITGLNYDLTKVGGNYPYQGGEVDHLMVWLKNLPVNYSIMFNLKQSGYKIGWFTSKKFLSDDPFWSPLNQIAEKADGYLMREPFVDGDTYLDEIKQATIDFVTTHQKYAVFLHTDPDEYGHEYGENSARYLEEFEKSDAAFGEILPFLTPDTIVIVVNDHGFDENTTNHMNSPDCWMVTNLPIDPFYTTEKKGANLRDIPFSILTHYGLDPSPYRRGKSLLP